MLVTKELCELIGITIGDGNIYFRNGSKYVLMITGNPKTDMKYFDHISNIIFHVAKKRPQIKTYSGGLRLRLHSKTLITSLIDEIGLPVGEGKCFTIRIPTMFLKNWKKLKYIIRGIADTDGSIFTSQKAGSPNYPSLEITTTSQNLALQLTEVLTARGYRIRTRHYIDKRYGTKTYKIALYGMKMIKKWLSDIGFSNPRKLRKAYEIISSSK